jgi:hypothetical protein
MRRLLTYIHELPDWPNFHWDEKALAERLIAVRHRQGRLIGRIEALGFPLRGEAMLQTLTEDVLNSSEIEGDARKDEEGETCRVAETREDPLTIDTGFQVTRQEFRPWLFAEEEQECGGRGGQDVALKAGKPGNPPALRQSRSCARITNSVCSTRVP